MKHLILIFIFLKFTFSYSFAEIINKVQVKNNDRITKETIISFGGIELGKNYSQEQLNNILLDLYSTNFFSDIKFEIQGDVLIVDVEERKIVQKIVLNGIKAQKTKNSILENLSLKEKSPYVNFLAKQDVKKIENSLNSSGYYFNKVDVTLKNNLLFVRIELKALFFVPFFISSICQLGDLFISYYKRRAKIKNTGNIIPGHGGLLDRIDGTIFALPIGFIIISLL